MRPTDDRPDIALMMRVRAGDEDAFAVIHDRYQRQMLNFFYGMSHDASTASDLCQETFLRLWKVRARYRAASTFPAFFFGIARMVWREYCRNRARRLQPETGWEQGAAYEPRATSAFIPDYRAVQSEIESYVMNALTSLPEEQRMVFVMRSIRGLALEDIAAAMDCSVNTVRSRKILGIKKLRHLLEFVFHRSEDRTLEEAPK